tara:strand:- start:167 stop:808 length:642 start_codon:yes stop_codon:yes gene_type:complete
MKVKIKKEGNTKEFNLIKSWSDVTLEKWIRLIELENKDKSFEAEATIKLLSDIPKKLIRELGIQDVAKLMSRIGELQANATVGLKNIIKIDGVEYGFHPDLEDITLGEWADIETFIKAGIEKNLPEIMAILYRPIKEKKNDAYIMGAYDGNIAVRAEKFKKMSAEQVQGALVFFWSFAIVSLKILPSFLMEQVNKKGQIIMEKISQKNGATSE